MIIDGMDMAATDPITRRRRTHDILRRLDKMTSVQLRSVLRKLTKGQRAELTRRWYGFEHDGQREPTGSA